jgi:hypothetical protein
VCGFIVRATGERKPAYIDGDEFSGTEWTQEQAE